jgi:multiple sugar transport system substrate-binding protein
MTRTKRLFGAFIGLAALIGVSACTPTSGSGEEATTSDATTSEEAVTSIEYWYWQDDVSDTTIYDLAVDFEAETGITVHFQDAIAHPRFYDALVNVIAAGNAPDVTHLNTNMMGQLIESDILEPLDSYIAEWDGADNVVDSMWDYVKNADGSGVYSMPHKYLMFFMFYRADLFEEAGIEVPKTQEEFLAAAEALTVPSKDQYGFDIRGGANGQDQWAAFLTAGGAKFLDENGDVAFDSPETQATNASYVASYEFAPPGSNTSGFAQIIANFQNGTAAMIINHLGAAKTLVTALGEDKVGAALVPGLTGDPATTTYMGTMNANGVLASSAKKEAAFKWVSFLAEAKAQEAITLSANGYLPIEKSVAADPQFDSNKFMQVSIAAANGGGVQSWPPIPGTTIATQQTWLPVFQAILEGTEETGKVVTDVANTLKGQ